MSIPKLYGVPIVVLEDYPPFQNDPNDELCSAAPNPFYLYYKTPTTCAENHDPKAGFESVESTILFAEAILVLKDRTYPVQASRLRKALLDYDEPVYPIPLGASVYFFAMIAWIIAFYFSHFGRKLMAGVIAKLDLYPEAHRFPDIPLYWLQQTKKESELRRDVRNTWAWLARRYLLSPDDPLLANVDEVITWHDFEVTRNTQSLINCVLRVNALFLKVEKKGDHRNFQILRDTDLTKVPMEGNEVKRIFFVEEYEKKRGERSKKSFPEMYSKDKIPIDEDSLLANPSTTTNAVNKKPKKKKKLRLKVSVKSISSYKLLAKKSSSGKKAKDKFKRRARKPMANAAVTSEEQESQGQGYQESQVAEKGQEQGPKAEEKKSVAVGGQNKKGKGQEQVPQEAGEKVGTLMKEGGGVQVGDQGGGAKGESGKPKVKKKKTKDAGPEFEMDWEVPPPLTGPVPQAKEPPN